MKERDRQLMIINNNKLRLLTRLNQKNKASNRKYLCRWPQKLSKRRYHLNQLLILRVLLNLIHNHFKKLSP